MLKTFSITDIGRKRKVNQDYLYTSEQPVGRLPNLFLVADGMGGHNAGDYASRAAVEIIVKEISDSEEGSAVRILGQAISCANEFIYRKSEESVEFEGMGTTVVAATIADGVLQVANVGDSRLYVIGKEVRQVTRDHSLVEEMVRMGGLGKSEARNHPDKNIITRAVGVSDTVEPDYFAVKLNEGELVLMCTDGLTNMLEDEEIRMILSGARDIVEKAQELVNAANKNGGKDNITVVLIEP